MLKSATPPAPPKPPIGEALRARRKEMQMSMQEVADEAGLSVGFISQIERGLSSPSLDSLSAIAGILRVPVGSLLDQPAENPWRTCKGARPTFSIGENDLVYERLSTNFNESRLRSVIVHEPPGHRYEPISHPGEELFFILSGSITVEIEGETAILGTGDSIHFDSHRTHSSWNHGEETASFIWCGTMDIFGESPNSHYRLHMARETTCENADRFKMPTN